MRAVFDRAVEDLHNRVFDLYNSLPTEEEASKLTPKQHKEAQDKALAIFALLEEFVTDEDERNRLSPFNE